jgi:hypothetical protein
VEGCGALRSAVGMELAECVSQKAQCRFELADNRIMLADIEFDWRITSHA